MRLSALAALDIQQAREWHDAREPGLGDQFLQRVNETMTRIGQNPHQYPTIIEDVRRANLRQFKYGVWYRVKVDGSVVVTMAKLPLRGHVATSIALWRRALSAGCTTTIAWPVRLRDRPRRSRVSFLGTRGARTDVH